MTRILNFYGDPGPISSCFMVEREHRSSHDVSCMSDDPRARLLNFNGNPCLISSCLMAKGLSGADQQLVTRILNFNGNTRLISSCFMVVSRIPFTRTTIKHEEMVTKTPLKLHFRFYETARPHPGPLLQKPSGV